MGEKHIYLVRHGQIEPGTSVGNLGPRLSDKGRAQAELIAQRLSLLPISVIHHSTLLRAVETAEIITARLPAVPTKASPLLRESVPYFPAALMEWYSGPNAPVENEARTAMGRWWGVWPLGTKWKAIEGDQAGSARAYE